MPQFPLIPNLQTQPTSPEDQALFDEIAKRQQSSLAPWKQGVGASIDAAGDLVSGAMSNPAEASPSYSFPKKLGTMLGVGLPALGMAGKVIKGGPAMQELLNLLWGFNEEADTPQILEALKRSKVTSTIRGNPPTIIKAPEGFAFRGELSAKPGRLRTGGFNGSKGYTGVPSGEDRIVYGRAHNSSSLKMAPTPANEQYAKWQEFLNRKYRDPNAIEVPKLTSGRSSIEDLMETAKAAPKSNGVRPAISGGGSNNLGRSGLYRSKLTIDQINNIRSYPDIESAAKAFPQMAKTYIKQIYNREIFPGVK